MSTMNSLDRLQRITTLNPDLGLLNRMRNEVLQLIDEDAAGLPWVQLKQRKDLEDELGKAGTRWEQERVLQRWIEVLSRSEST